MSKKNAEKTESDKGGDPVALVACVPIPKGTKGWSGSPLQPRAPFSAAPDVAADLVRLGYARPA